MLPSGTDLQYFIETAATLNLSRAAERLGISQPTLSLAIQRLESAFGLPLLIRGKSGVRLTHAGQKLVSRARDLVSHWEGLRGDALRDATETGGRYVLGCHPSVAIYALPYFVPRLLGEHPRLELKLAHDLSRRVTEDVVSFKIDFGIVVNPVPHPELVIRRLGTDEVTLWAVPGAVEDVLICDPDLLQTQDLLKRLGREGRRFTRQLHTGNLEVVLALAASGAGAAVLPTRVAAHQPRLKRISKLAYQDRICLVYRADAQSSRGARTISQSIEKYLKNFSEQRRT